MDEEEFIPSKQRKLDTLPFSVEETECNINLDHLDGLMFQCPKQTKPNIGNGSYNSLSSCLKVTIMATGWGLNSSPVDDFSSILNKMLVVELVKFPQVEITFLIPEDSCSEIDKREAASCGITIVEAEKQPGFDDPIEWLNFPPKYLTTDIVVGVGERLSKVAQIFKKHHHCKSIFCASDSLKEIQNESKRLSAKLAGLIEQESDVRYQRNVGVLSPVADLSVAIGPKMADRLSASLCYEKKRVFELTPGILSEFEDVSHATADRKKFRILVTGSDDPRNFYQEGLNIVAQAVAELNDGSYELVYVGAAKGKHAGFVKKFHQCGVPKYQLTIRSIPKDEEELKRWFCESDLAIMPSSEEEFGMMGLAALSSGLPVLVHGASGFGEALRPIKFGTSSIVDSENAKEWAKAIKKVRDTDRMVRLEQAALLRSNYNKEYSWEKQCGALVEEMLKMVSAQQSQS